MFVIQSNNMLVPETFVDNSDKDILLEKLENSVTPKLNVKKEVQSGGIISDLFDKDILAFLESVFSTSESGFNSLTAQEFKDLIIKYIPLSLVENIYRAIDVNDLGYVYYSDFTNYLISSEAGTSFSSKTYTTRIVMVAQQEENMGIMHRDFVDCLAYVKKPCPMLITGGRDGQISLWDPSDLSWIKHVQHRDNNSVYQEELHKSMDTLLKAQCSKLGAASSRKKKSARVSATRPTVCCAHLMSRADRYHSRVSAAQLWAAVRGLGGLLRDHLRVGQPGETAVWARNLVHGERRRCAAGSRIWTTSPPPSSASAPSSRAPTTRPGATRRPATRAARTATRRCATSLWGTRRAACIWSVCTPSSRCPRRSA